VLVIFLSYIRLELVIGQRVGRLGNYLLQKWLTQICLSKNRVVIIAMACTVACSMVPCLGCWTTTDRESLMFVSETQIL